MQKSLDLEKNSSCLQLTELTDCCQKKCVQQFSSSHLDKIRSDFESMYCEQNIYLNGVLKHHETKKSSVHTRKKSSTVSLKGKRCGRPPAEESKFTFE